jgi:hypothetical protein
MSRNGHEGYHTCEWRDRVDSAVVRKTVSLAGLLVAWLCANGALLDVAQIFAWGKMFAGYIETMSAGAALAQTFDPAKPCEICLSVSHAKQKEASQAPVTTERNPNKVVLALEASPPLAKAALPVAWPRAIACSGPTRWEVVPVPPPRV